MDSLTQVILGASIGELVCGKKEGNRAMLFGAIAGTIPDLDVLASPFQDSIEYMEGHRSLTHSLLFSFIVAPICGWIVFRLYTKLSTDSEHFPAKKRASYWDWTKLFFFGFVTHWLLDCFTTWGTQIFYPFSRHGVAWKTIFVIDPLYTLPFMFFLLLASFKGKNNPKRRLFNHIGLVLSSSYLVLTVVNKQLVHTVFEEALQKQKIEYLEFDTHPTALNNILWSVNVKTKTGYYIGYYSFFDENKEIDFVFLKKNEHLLNEIKNQEKLQSLIRVTQDYYTVDKTDNQLIVNDLRFGKVNVWQNKLDGEFVFSYEIETKKNQLNIEKIKSDLAIDWKTVTLFHKRIFGEK
jgi:inner membrane protein